MSTEMASAPAPKAKRAFSSLKNNWVLTYGDLGHWVTAAALQTHGSLEADECHSTVIRGRVYTYVHLKKQARQSALDRFIANFQREHAFRLQKPYDDESVGSTSFKMGASMHIKQHEGLQMLAKHMNEKNASFRPWTDGKAEVTRGVLHAMRVVPKRGVASKTAQVEQLRRELRESKELVTAMTVEADAMGAEKQRLAEKVETLVARLDERHREMREMEGAVGEVEKVKKDLEACQALVRERDDEIARKDSEIDAMRKKDAERAADLASIDGLRKECADNAAKALAHDSVVEENKAIMAHAVSLDARIRAMEVRSPFTKTLMVWFGCVY